MRHLTLVVLFVFAALVPMQAAAAGPADCVDRSPAVSVSGAADPTAAEALFSPEKPQNKVCIYICAPWGTNTSMQRGTGSDCTASTNNLRNNVGSAASAIGPGVCSDSAFGYCGFNLVTTVSCHWDFVLGTYVTDGYGEIKCKDWC